MLRQPTIPAGYRAAERTDEGLFQPATKGDLRNAFSSRQQMEVIAPESPRPAEMLEGVSVNGRDMLTADDEALHDFLVTRAYGDDQPMTAETHSLDMAEAVRYLGSRVERADIRASLARLKATTVSYGQPGGRRFEDAQLLEGWIEVAPGSDVIRYRLPEPIRVLMRNQRSYAYIELAALPRMRSKFSSRLYKAFALRAKDSPWVAGDGNVVTVTGTPDEVAAWISFPVEANGRVHGGKLKARFLDKVVADFGDVRAFRLEMELDQGGRGNALRSVTFRLRIAPPARHSVPMFFKPSDTAIRIGGKDLPAYRVESRTWRRAGKKFARTVGMTNRDFAELWQVALSEALSEEALSDGFHTRAYRGRRLLDAVASRGADYAAWGFVCEEADQPDLLAKRCVAGFVHIVNDADVARLQRVGMAKRKAPAFIADNDEEVAEAAVKPAEAPAKPAAVAVPPAGTAGAVTFGTCSRIILPLDDALNHIDADTFVGAPIKRMKWTGTRCVKLVLTYAANGGRKQWVLGSYPVSEADLDEVLKRFGRHFDGIEEYA